jgi:ankyrin repeat protein
MRWRSEGNQPQQNMPQNEVNDELDEVPSIDSTEESNTADDEKETSRAYKPASQDIDNEEDIDQKPLDSPSPKTSPQSPQKRRAKGKKKKSSGDDGSDHATTPPEDEIVWKPQNEDSTCEFTHTIENYAQKRESGCKKAEYSAITVDDKGNKWRLIIYVNGNGRASNHHLSLFLQVADAETLPFGWKKAVSYVLTLEHPKGGNLGYAKRNPDKMFKLCPKAIDWGWSQFITSDRIQQEGYIQNDSLTVRASVTVKSSSTTIDKDDAELYLKYAVEDGNPEAVKTCLAQGAGVNCKFKDDMYTPLHTACSSSTVKGSLDVLNLLLERGADANSCNKWKETPLLIAANNGHTTAVKALLKNAADPSLCSEAGWSALTFAAHKGYDDIVTLLLKANAPVNCQVTEDLSTPLHKACAGSKAGHLSAVRQLLAAGADVHALNKWRETPLLTAANHGQAEAVDALLRAGADPCRCTDTGWSPLSIAAYKGHDEVVRLLLEEGAPTEEDDPTLSALLQAATKGLPDTVELLLRHGADHTVTTKKGDTTLSILVEQGLIDSAVEMVTEYKASIARCSRDRKKVQRARLLINLRIKKQQRDGLLSIDSDDETDDEESNDSRSALHDENSNALLPSPPSSKKKKKNAKGSKESAEAQARAAEEALLLELEQEETKAQQHEAAVNSKRAKRKKKKERERQQKLKEEQERREREEKEAQERARLQKLKDEKESKVRQQQEKERRQREEEEAAERERIAAAKRKEEALHTRQREQSKKSRENAQHAEKEAVANGSPKSTAVPAASEKRMKATASKSKGPKKSIQSLQASVNNLPLISKPQPQLMSVNANSAVKKRGWETASPVPSSSSVVSGEKNRDIPMSPGVSSVNSGNEDIRENRSANIVEFGSQDPWHQASQVSGQSSAPRSRHDIYRDNAGRQPHNPVRSNSSHSPVGSVQLSGRLENLPSFDIAGSSMELPGIAMYRQEKLVEIFQRCAVAKSQPQSSDPLRAVDEAIAKVVMYRWIVRAAHGSVSFMDSVIPSWTDFELLSTFFQRQFIAESRKGNNVSRTSGMVSMEALKEAGNAMAGLCHSHAEDLMQASRKLEEQLPPDWTDSTLRLSASEVNQNGLGPMVLIDWASRAQVCIPMLTFAKLRDRYKGPPGRILTAIFAAKRRYELLNVLVAGTAMDYRLSPSTKSCAEREIGASGELWSDPFSAVCPIFCGHFPDIDAPFGGLPPFAKEGGGGELFLLGHCASVAGLLPFDNTVASLYVRRMVDTAEAGDKDNVPISFAAVLSEACFHDINRTPTVNDLPLLDPRLNDAHRAYVRFAEVLHPGQHSYYVGSGDGQAEISQSGSLFVLLQNDVARSRFPYGEVSLLNIVQSLSVNIAPPPSDLPMVSSIGFSSSFNSTEQHANAPPVGYHDPIATHSPLPQPQELPSDFGTLGAPSVVGPSSGDSRRNTRRGRLFDLVDNGEGDDFNDADVVSGMLSNLNVDLFQSNPPQDVDIEAISLMGIGNFPRENDQHTFGPGSGRTTSRFA